MSPLRVHSSITTCSVYNPVKRQSAVKKMILHHPVTVCSDEESSVSSQLVPFWKMNWCCRPQLLHNTCMKQYSHILENSQAWQCHFKPKQYWCLSTVKISPPRDIRVNGSSEDIEITWMSGYEDHKSITDLEYTISIEVTNAKAKSKKVRHTLLFSLKPLLDPYWFILIPDDVSKC